MHRLFAPLIFILLFSLNCRAQSTDTLSKQQKRAGAIKKSDSLLSKPFMPAIKPLNGHTDHPDSTHSPHKAFMRSLIMPGLGQIYNRHGLWWRLPLIYGGFYLLYQNIKANNDQYHIFLAEAVWRDNGRIGPEPHPEYAQASDAAVVDVKDISRRNRDLTIFATVAAWGVNCADAYVEAKFMHSYSMDNNLSFKISPSLINQPVYASNFNTFTPGIKLTLTF